jgi:hypothetical protein
MVLLRRFSMEAKKFELLVGEGASVLRLEERRRGFSHVAFLGALCTGWLSSTVEELVRNSGSTDFIKSFREGSKVSIAQRGSNNSGRFLEVAVYALGGRRSLIMIPEGREGRGWSRFGAELSKVKNYFKSLVGSSAVMLRPPFGVPSSSGKNDGSGLGLDATHSSGIRSLTVRDAPSFAEVVRLGVPMDKKCSVWQWACVVQTFSHS